MNTTWSKEWPFTLVTLFEALKNQSILKNNSIRRKFLHSHKWTYAIPTLKDIWSHVSHSIRRSLEEEKSITKLPQIWWSHLSYLDAIPLTSIAWHYIMEMVVFLSILLAQSHSSQSKQEQMLDFYNIWS